MRCLRWLGEVGGRIGEAFMAKNAGQPLIIEGWPPAHIQQEAGALRLTTSKKQILRTTSLSLEVDSFHWTLQLRRQPT